MINLANIKKWLKMISGKSILHVKQDKGKRYSFIEVSGYYNDLTNKILCDKDHTEEIWPFKSLYDGKLIYFSIAIFQYGLAAYDLFLETNDDLYFQKFIKHADWAVENQNSDGAWDTFGYKFPNHKYSAMAQGEGISLLVRAYKATQRQKYLESALKAYDFMLTPLEKNGTAKYDKDGIVFYEYTNFPCVFNGWIFAMFGIIDLFLLTKDSLYKDVLDKSIKSFKLNLVKMDIGYWSLYRDDGTIASPFYHDLHIALLDVLYEYSNEEIFKEYRDKFIYYKNKKIYKIRAFIKKAIQKIIEK